MGLSLKESQAVAAMAETLYDFLPGSGHREWKGHITFQTIARRAGVERFWPGGSKLPALTALLRQTLEHERSRFEPVILDIVREGITYRQKQGNPVKAEEVERLNGLLLQVEFKFPDLWDRDFLDTLRTGVHVRAKEHVERARREQEFQASQASARHAELQKLRDDFFELQRWSDRQAAGRALEKILNRLFALFELAPREPFRLVGEQIDGSFELFHETYLLEAKWEKDQLPEHELLVFHGKKKSEFSRGVVIAINDFTAEAKQAFLVGKRPWFFAVNGHDLAMILGGDVGLVDFLHQRQRLLDEEGAVFVPYGELWKGSRAR